MAFAAQGVGDQTGEFGFLEQFLRSFDIRAGGHVQFGVGVETCEAHPALDAVQRALHLYRDQPDDWLRLMRTGMKQDWSWDRSAAEYEKLYERLCGRREG